MSDQSDLATGESNYPYVQDQRWFGVNKVFWKRNRSRSENWCLDCGIKFSLLRRRIECSRCRDMFCSNCVDSRITQHKEKPVCRTCRIVLEMNECSLSESSTRLNLQNDVEIGNEQGGRVNPDRHFKLLKRYENDPFDQNVIDRFLLSEVDKGTGDSKKTKDMDNNESSSSKRKKKTHGRTVSFAESKITFPLDEQGEGLVEENDLYVSHRENSIRKQRIDFAKWSSDLEKERRVAETKQVRDSDSEIRRIRYEMSKQMYLEEEKHVLAEKQQADLEEILNRRHNVIVVDSLSRTEKQRRLHEARKKLFRWVPNHLRKKCQSCHSLFWLLRRKHHCRCCGEIFDRNCCRKYNLKTHKLRLCSSCFAFKLELELTLLCIPARWNE